MTVSLILMILVVVFLGCSAFNVPPLNPKINWLGLGMFVWAVKVLVTTF